MQIYNKQWKWSKWDLDWSANKVDGSCPGTSFLLLTGWISIRWKVHVLVTLIPQRTIYRCKAFRFFSELWTAGYPLLFTCEQLERNLRNIVIFAGINELKSFFLCVILSECLTINSVSVAWWTKASTWREKEAQMFVRGHNLFQGANSLPRAKLKENCEVSCHLLDE